MLRRVQVKMSRQVYDMTDVRDRVKCLAASVAIYRLFAPLMKLAPGRDQRVKFPLGSSFGGFLNQICRLNAL